MAVAAVIGDNDVFRVKSGTHAGTHCLLARAQDHHTGNFPLNLTELHERVLKPTSEEHRAQHVPFFLFRNRHRFSLIFPFPSEPPGPLPPPEPWPLPRLPRPESPFFRCRRALPRWPP